VAVTGYGQASDRMRSAVAGFVAHVVKPVDIDEVLRLAVQGPSLGSAPGGSAHP
jgi:CheY-like chemotaxis protein